MHKGHLQYICGSLLPRPDAPHAQAATVAADAGASDPAVTQAQAFSLHSRPGASKVILLDFDGCVTTGTRWNSNGNTIVSPAYNIDSDPASFSAAELSNIYAIWRAVAEDFSPFDVDVTTEDPGDAALLGRGMRAVIGGTYNNFINQAGYGAPAGGFSFQNSFGSSDAARCFIFSESLNGVTRFVWESTSHEVGHTLGLIHDGTATNAYYSGNSNWAPIMVRWYGSAPAVWARGQRLLTCLRACWRLVCTHAHTQNPTWGVVQ